MEDVTKSNLDNLSSSHFIHKKMNLPFFEYTREEQSTHIECMGPRENNCTSHFHSHIEIFLLHKGKQQVTINNRTEILKAGQLSVADTLEPHSYLYKAGSISTVFIIPPIYLTDYFTYKNSGKLGTNFIMDKKIYDECVDLVEKITSSQNLLSQKGYINVMLGIITKYCKILPPPQHIRNEVDFVSSVLEYISANITENITQASIAQAFNYSVSHFSKKFNAIFNCPLNHYLNEVRLTKFLELKELHPDMALTTLIMESGFQSTTSFYRYFAKKLGVPPSKFFKTLNIPENVPGPDGRKRPITNRKKNL